MPQPLEAGKGKERILSQGPREECSSADVLTSAILGFLPPGLEDDEAVLF